MSGVAAFPPIPSIAAAATHTPSRLRALVSVRDPAEARLAAAAGVHTIDLKEPADGALGGLPLPRLAATVQALRAGGWPVSISATVGDWPAACVAWIVHRVRQVAACGVDQVKVGIPAEPEAPALLQALAALARDEARVIVPVLLADEGVDAPRLAAAIAGRFPAVMLDTARKRGGSLLQRIDAAELKRLVRALQASGAQVGLAGALRLDEIPALRALGADYAGFRSAVCAGDRAGGLDEARVRALVAALAGE